MLLLLLACDGSGGAAPPPPPRSRVDAIAAAPKKEVTTDAFCESRPNKAFALPELDAATPADDPGWTWVNVWATWCQPCIEEMPMLVRWRERMKGEGVDVALRFLSVDNASADVAKFRAAHPEAPESVRIRDFALLPPWLESVGLDATAVLPIHLFVNPANEVACVRMGAIEVGDYDVVKKVVSGG